MIVLPIQRLGWQEFLYKAYCGTGRFMVKINLVICKISFTTDFVNNHALTKTIAGGRGNNAFGW